MALAAEPLSLRLPRDLLVLQPMQGHLDLEPVLLAPGLRCTIGSAESCAVRLTKSALVQPEHCCIEVDARQTRLTEWVPESTWLNDRLVYEPRELVSGDRISIGPFEFRLRLASADELLYAKLVDRDSHDPSQVEDVLRLKRAIGGSGRDSSTSTTVSEPTFDRFGEMLRETGDSADADTHDRLTQHISKLLGDLQSQVFALQEKEAELTEQIRTQRSEVFAHPEPIARRPAASESLERIPDAVRPDFAEVLQLLKAERDQLDEERAQFVADQTQWHDQQRDWTERLQSLEQQLAELEEQRQSVFEEREISRTLATELLRDKSRMDERERRLEQDEAELLGRRAELTRLEQDLSARRDLARATEFEATPSPASAFASPLLVASMPWSAVNDQLTATNVPSASNRPLQTLLTLLAFCVSAFFLSGTLGTHDAWNTLGWSTALVGALSTVDLLLRRCLQVA